MNDEQILYREIANALRDYYSQKGRPATVLYCNVRRRRQLTGELAPMFGFTKNEVASGRVSFNFGYGPVELHTDDDLDDDSFTIGEHRVCGFSLESYAGLGAPRSEIPTPTPRLNRVPPTV